MKACERCGATLDPDSYDLLDHCVLCGKDLCDRCVLRGCCGLVPADIGQFDDD